jgi:hypothetical protein
MLDFGRKTRLRSYAQLRSEDVTPVISPIPIGRYDSGCIPNSGHISQHRSHFLTSVDIMTPVVHHSSGRWACHKSYQLICERLRMVELDDCSTLQLEHLVGSNLSRAHDLFSIRNLITLRLCMFKSQAMCRVTNKHLAQLDLRETWVSRRTQYPL